jgi:hypothetical protein
MLPAIIQTKTLFVIEYSCGTVARNYIVVHSQGRSVRYVEVNVKRGTSNGNHRTDVGAQVRGWPPLPHASGTYTLVREDGNRPLRWLHRKGKAWNTLGSVVNVECTRILICTKAWEARACNKVCSRGRQRFPTAFHSLVIDLSLHSLA